MDPPPAESAQPRSPTPAPSPLTPRPRLRPLFSTLLLPVHAHPQGVGHNVVHGGIVKHAVHPLRPWPRRKDAHVLQRVHPRRR